ncbi:MAG: ferredoxin [Burkholderiales bacterium PBB4]|nr:MAG: ferredoxin [Burkholderiales bacterium PBB4]
MTSGLGHEAGLAARLLDALPQTQCTRCGYPDCAAYASAMAVGEAGINQCPPGGTEGIARLSQITGRPALPLDPQFGTEGPRSTVFIDENWCIGCTLCLDACPTDAIVGSNKRMHTVVEAYCTGCELCLPACPVDCIVVENVSGTASGWKAWSQAQADLARKRYAQGVARRQVAVLTQADRLEAKAEAKLADLPAHSQHTDPAVLDQKRSIIEAALARARAKRAERT